VVAADARFSQVLAEHIAVVPEVPRYQPGKFYRRELPPLRAVLDGIGGLGLLVVDGYADLDPDGRPGLGAHAHTEFGIPVIGVAKSAFATATHAVAVLRGTSAARCLSPPPGCPAPTRQSWSAAWRAGSGYPMRCAAPTHSPAPAYRRLLRGALTPAYRRAERA
jgi:hypothetical protein